MISNIEFDYGISFVEFEKAFNEFLEIKQAIKIQKKILRKIQKQIKKVAQNTLS